MSNPNRKIIFLTVPGLRHQDLTQMPNLARLCESGTNVRLKHSFPCVTWPSQANMLTGTNVSDHGVVANGFYWRDTNQVEMWTAWNEVIERPQIWDELKKLGAPKTSAAWFPMLSKGCGADFVCMPAPIHQPDGSEELWCYTKPQEFYGELLDRLGHFPLQHFWGPLANIKSTQWIVDSALAAAKKFVPDFFYIYLPHLDYAAQKCGPDSSEANAAVVELDQLIGKFVAAIDEVYSDQATWMVASEYVITEVNHVTYPNRVLRDAGFLELIDDGGREQLDYQNSPAWALVDHQFSHVFVKDSAPETIAKVVELFSGRDGFEFVLTGEQRSRFSMSHERTGDVVLISEKSSWQAYYWWNDDSKAPTYASTVDIHRKPGYDPVELHFDFTTKSVPLDATLIKGSHGAPANSADQKGVFLCSEKLELESEIIDTEIFDLVVDQFN